MDETKSIRILVVDDHFTVRMGLAASLSAESDMVVVAESDGSADITAIFASYAPTVVIMDLRLNGTSGIDLTKSLMCSHPKARILMLSTYHNEEGIAQALAAGVRGYVLKTVQREELLQAVRTVHSGETYMDAVAAQAILERTKRKGLTQRELEVLQLIVRGCSNKEIAQKLFVAEVTIKLHVTHVLEKLGVTDRTQAAIVAMQRGFVTGLDV